MIAVSPAAPKRARRRGQTMLEFSIVAIAFFVTLFGTMQMGEAVYCYTAVSDAARAAVRYAIVHSPTSANPATTSQIQQQAINAASGLSSQNLTVTVTWPADPNVPTKDDAQVVVSYKFKMQIPLVPTTSVTLTSTSRMLVSQ